MADKKTPFDDLVQEGTGAATPFDDFVEKPTETMPLSALAGERFLDSLLAAPSGSGDALAAGAAVLGGIPGLFTDRGFDFSGRFDEEKEKFPANVLRSIPRPTIGEIGAGSRALFGEGPFMENYGQEMAEQDVMRMNTQRESPVASNVFPLFGDAAAVMTGRMPFLNKISNFEDALMTVNKPDLYFGTMELAQAPVGVMSAAKNAITQSTAVRKLLRATGRSVEAGLEATALDIVNGNDPGETFGYAAGLQAASSGLLAGMQGLTRGGAGPAAMKLAAAGYVGASLWNMFQIATPIDNNFLEALNAGNEKVLAGLVLGTAAGLSGGGRIRGTTAEMTRTYQVMLDSLASVPRATTIGIMRQMSEADEDGRQAALDLLELMSMNPQNASSGEVSRINKAIEMGTLTDTATVMLRDNRFVERMVKPAEPRKVPPSNIWDIAP